MFSGFDPFQSINSVMRRQMEDMDAMMNSMMNPFVADPFMMPGFMGPRFDHGARQQMIDDSNHFQRRNNSSMAMMPFGGGFLDVGLFGGGLIGPGFMNNMFNQMENLRTSAATDPNSVVYSENKVISIAPGPDGRLQRFESSDSLRKHGAVKETRRTLRDPSRGLEEMAIGHHIGDRGHVIEKRRGRDGNIEENQDFIGIDKNEARRFDAEWSQATKNAVNNKGNQLYDDAYYRRRLPIDSRRSDRERQASPYSRSMKDQHRKPKGPIIEEAD